MNHNAPLITVYVTTCNRSELLARALDSVISQDYRPLEMIVVDDASRDNTVEVMRRYEERFRGDPYFTFVSLMHETNKGACAARNSAIFRAKGVFITGLDDDDEFLPGRISTLAGAWDDSFSALCTAKEIDDGSGKVSYLKKHLGPISLNALLEKNVVGSQIFTRTERLQAIGGFDENFPAWQDYETWIRMAITYGQLLKLPDVSYRVHTAHDKPRITSNEKSLAAISLLRDKHGGNFSRHHLRQLKYKELTAAKTGYRYLSVWVPAMTLSTFPRIMRRWLTCRFTPDS